MPAYPGTHASGRAGLHFELFGSILGTVTKLTTHNHSLRVQYVRGNAKKLIWTCNHKKMYYY